MKDIWPESVVVFLPLGDFLAARPPHWTAPHWRKMRGFPSCSVLFICHLSRVFWKAAFCSNPIIRHCPWWSSRKEINFNEKKISTRAWKDLYSYPLGGESILMWKLFDSSSTVSLSSTPLGCSVSKWDQEHRIQEGSLWLCREGDAVHIIIYKGTNRNGVLF